MSAETYLISEKELLRLIRRDELLDALEVGGVDDWEGWDWSLEDYVEAEDIPDNWPTVLDTAGDGT